jgi:hypothetical protein
MLGVYIIAIPMLLIFGGTWFFLPLWITMSDTYNYVLISSHPFEYVMYQLHEVVRWTFNTETNNEVMIISMILIWLIPMIIWAVYQYYSGVKQFNRDHHPPSSSQHLKNYLKSTGMVINSRVEEDSLNNEESLSIKENDIPPTLLARGFIIKGE